MDVGSFKKSGPILILGRCGVGGAARWFYEEVSYFVNHGFETHALSLNEVPPDIFDGAYKVKIEGLNKRSHSKGFLLPGMDRIIQVLALRRKIKKIKPAVIIAQGTEGCSVLYLATLFTPFPYVTHIHQTVFWPDSVDTFEKYAIIHRKVFNEIRESVPERKQFLPLHSKASLRHRLLGELKAIAQYIGVRKARRIFVPSNQMKWEVNKLYGKDAIVLRVGAFHPQMLHYQPRQDIKQKLGLTNKRMILNVCNLIPKKRVDLLIRAFAQACKEFDDIALVIGGKGEEGGRLRNMVAELNIGDKVEFRGYIPQTELWDYYAACDLFVHLDCADVALSAYEPLALQKKVVWSTETELDPFLAQNRHIFITKPTIDDAARAIKEALITEIPERNDLTDYTWEAYFENLTREILPIMIEGEH